MSFDASVDLFHLKGFGNVIHPPYQKHVDLSSASFSALRKITGMARSLGSDLSRSHTSNPSISGMVMSNRMRSGWSLASGGKRQTATGEGSHSVSFVPQHILHQLQIGRLIVNHHDAAGSISIHPVRQASASERLGRLRIPVLR